MQTPPRFTTETQRPSRATLAVHRISNDRLIAIGGTVEQMQELFQRHGNGLIPEVTPLDLDELKSVEPAEWNTITGSTLDDAHIEKAIKLGIVDLKGPSIGDIYDSIRELAEQLRRTDTIAVFIDWK